MMMEEPAATLTIFCNAFNHRQYCCPAASLLVLELRLLLPLLTTKHDKKRIIYRMTRTASTTTTRIL